MKSFLISLGGDKAGRIVDLLTYYSTKDNLKGSVEVEVYDCYETPLEDAEVYLDGEKKTEAITKKSLKVSASEEGYNPAERFVDLDEEKSYLIKVGLTPTEETESSESISGFLLVLFAPFLWVAMKYSGILPSIPDVNYLTTAAVILVLEFIGVVLGYFILGNFLVKKISNTQISKGLGIIIGAYFATTIPLMFGKTQIFTPIDVAIIALLVLILFVLGLVINMYAYRFFNRKILNTSICSGVGSLAGGLIAYYIIDNYIRSLFEVPLSGEILILLPVFVSIGSILWSYVFINAFQETIDNETYRGALTLVGVMLISTVLLVSLKITNILLPFVGLSVLGSLIGFILSFRLPEGKYYSQEKPFFNVIEKNEEPRQRKYFFPIQSMAVDNVESRIENLHFVPQDNKIYITSDDTKSQDQIFAIEKERVRVRINKIFEKALEECSKFFNNFVLFVDLRNSDMCENVPKIAQMLKEEFSIPVYVFVLTTKNKVNYKWLKEVALVSDAIFPVDYELFEDNTFLDTISYEKDGERVKEDVVEEGSVVEIIRRCAPILEAGSRRSPSGSDVSHIIRTLRKDVHVSTGCDVISDVLPPSKENTSTIGYFRVNMEKCDEVNFEVEMGNYLAYALKNVLWDLNTNGDRVRATVLLRGNRDSLKTALARSWFKKLFSGITITVGDLIDENTKFLEIIILLSHVIEELPDKPASGGCSESSVSPSEPDEPDQTTPTTPTPKPPEPQKTPRTPTTVPEEDDRYSTYYSAYANMAARHYAKPIVRQMAVKIARDYPGTLDWRQVKAIYEWVRDNINYVCDPEGSEYIQSPEESLEVKGGDCDDQAVLLASLLMAVGFKVEMVFIPHHIYVAVNLPNVPEEYRTYGSKVRDDLSDWKDWVGMDPTCYNCEFGQLPEDDYKMVHVEKIEV